MSRFAFVIAGKHACRTSAAAGECAMNSRGGGKEEEDELNLSLDDLQAELEAVQEEEPSTDKGNASIKSNRPKLSARNCMELVGLLQQKGYVQIVYTLDGEEFVTPSQLRKEVVEEISLRRGRTDNRTVQMGLNVDFNHVEKAIQGVVEASRTLYDENYRPSKAAKEYGKGDTSTQDVVASMLGCRVYYLESGDIVSDAYVDKMCHDVHELLCERGKVTCGAVAERFQLPLVFVKDMLSTRTKDPRTNNIYEEQEGRYTVPALWRQEQQALYTLGYVETQKQQLVAALIAVTRPVVVDKVLDSLSSFDMDKTLCLSMLAEVTQQLPGVIQGPTYTPHAFLLSQRHSALSFFASNGYISFDRLKKLRIENGLSLLEESVSTEHGARHLEASSKGMIDQKKLDELTLSLPSSTKLFKLDSCIISNAFLEQLSASVEDTANSRTWINLVETVPPEIEARDVCVLAAAFHSHNSQTTMRNMSPSIKLLDQYNPVSSQLSCTERALPQTSSSKQNDKRPTSRKQNKGSGKRTVNRPESQRRPVPAVLVCGVFIVSIDILDKMLSKFSEQASKDAAAAAKTVELERQLRKIEEASESSSGVDMDAIKSELESLQNNVSIAAKRHRKRKRPKEPLITPQEAQLMLLEWLNKGEIENAEDMSMSEVPPEVLEYLQDDDDDFDRQRILSADWKAEEELGKTISGSNKVESVLVSCLLGELWPFVKTIFGSCRHAAFKGDSSAESRPQKRLTPSNKRACCDCAQNQLDISIQMVRRLLNTLQNWPAACDTGPITSTSAKAVQQKSLEKLSSVSQKLFHSYSAYYAYLVSLDATLLWCCATTNTTIVLESDDTTPADSPVSCPSPFDAVIQGSVVADTGESSRSINLTVMRDILDMDSSDLRVAADTIPFEDSQTEVKLIPDYLREKLKQKLHVRLESSRAYYNEPTIVRISDTESTSSSPRLSPEDCGTVESFLEYYELKDRIRKELVKVLQQGRSTFSVMKVDSEDTLQHRATEPLDIDAKLLREKIQEVAKKCDIRISTSAKKEERSSIFLRRQLLVSMCKEATEWNPTLSLVTCFLWHRQLKADMVCLPSVAMGDFWYIFGIAKSMDGILEDTDVTRYYVSLLSRAAEEQLNLATVDTTAKDSLETIRNRLVQSIQEVFAQA
eukprot:gb/GECG01008951.1/.p1 GENE.gb/GECG01008951.1/~~gb/GECG01008951.1/.p1  ORF type:complete len:1155 (+),score=165.69 gb/GECG01008951.1/:1-3465(+)